MVSETTPVWPKHVKLVGVAVASNALGWVTNVVKRATQPAAEVTVTLYVPADNPVMDVPVPLPVPAGLTRVQVQLYGAGDPEMAMLMVPSEAP